ncbi:NAD(P)H-dependent oxidoreductase [Stieleria sp. JC731]|uniref:NADPH-dependent FMN reductase n=1 Tax=Pirellulaceae TaxID=2691357 RepID=UPI001E426BB0|nr:NAD(P)H-dependent oxidoreductase [Stieleria sp. JC731]MCC9599563.1 NAD(P)H-dependent oxidoreductase [Stieleria sp. JC731]
MILVISASLNPGSRSRLLATAAKTLLTDAHQEVAWYDLAESPLPFCDGASAYGDANVIELGKLIESADAVMIASPIYNYDVNAAIKNAVELTGKKWTGKVVAMMLAAGGAGSYMSAMGLANSLMLDFRCLIVPRFVYATGDAFEGNEISNEAIQTRLEQMVNETIRLAKALAQ